ncbi:MAG: O-antigen ligase family protein [Cyclobacteriaceae bacterium]|nr:O-antigen ligase family protein [Cyclobacteriaceae bacterium]
MMLYNKKRYLKAATLLLAFSIPISSFLNARILVVCLVLALLNLNISRLKLSLFSDILVYLIVLICGVFYSAEWQTGLRVLETNFSFVAIPLIIVGFNSTTDNGLNELIYSFVAGLFVACVIVLVHATVNYFLLGGVSNFFFYQLTDVLNSHPTYLAYYLIFAITYGLCILYYNLTTFKHGIIISLIFFFFIVLMLTGGRTAFISASFVFAFFILKFLVDYKNSFAKRTFVVVILMLLCLFIVNGIEQEGRNVILDDSWERYVLWESALQAVPDIVFGVGTGDYRETMNAYYITHNLTFFAKESYNSHNQFIQILLTNGIFGLVAVLILICRPIFLAVKHHHVLGVLVFFPFLLYGMTEVFLGRYQGVVFFALLHQVFVSYYLSLKSEISALKDP